MRHFKMDTLGTDPKFLPKGGSATRSAKRSVSVATLLALGVFANLMQARGGRAASGGMLWSNASAGLDIALFGVVQYRA